jgi:hypothetical protein
MCVFFVSRRTSRQSIYRRKIVQFSTSASILVGKILKFVQIRVVKVKIFLIN